MSRLREIAIVMGLALCGALGMAAPAVAATGSISGTVTAADSGDGARQHLGLRVPGLPRIGHRV